MKQEEEKKQPGMPPAFATAKAAGPEVLAATFAEAEKLARVRMTEKHQAEAAGSWPQAMAPLYERRTGPRTVELPETVSPGSRWNPLVPEASVGAQRNVFAPALAEAGKLPEREEEIAFAAVWQLAHWIRTRQLKPSRLTEIYLDRLKRHNGKLRCVITLTEELARAQARRADEEIAAGRYRGPLHGIPWGAKDLLDTARIPTTYGAEPFRNRVPDKNAVVVDRLEAAGIVTGEQGRRLGLVGPVARAAGVGIDTRVNKTRSWFVNAGVESARGSFQEEEVNAGIKLYF